MIFLLLFFSFIVAAYAMDQSQPHSLSGRASSSFRPSVQTAAASHSVSLTKEHDDVIINIHDDNLPDSPTSDVAIRKSGDGITINISEGESIPNHLLPPKKRLLKCCLENKTAIIAASATVTAATIAGTVALIVHFTAA